MQRVPKTESQGRIHTSTATVAVLPEAEEVDVEIDPNDLQIDVYRSSGPGGQSVNTTDSAVRVTHKPTGIVVSMQDEKSQLQNREKAMRVLRARLLEREIAEQQAKIASERRAQVGTGERSEKIRTYNFPQDRITDHRVKLTASGVERVLGGELDEFTDALSCRGEAPAARGSGCRGLSEAKAIGHGRELRCRCCSPPPADAIAAAGVGHGSPGRGASALRGDRLGSIASVVAEPRSAGCPSAPRASSPRWSAAELRREPVAYILGRKGFRRIELLVDHRVLIPRPETELLVEIALEVRPRRVLDVGTGSGALALALADELPECHVVAIDTSMDVLRVAQTNADRLGLAGPGRGRRRGHRLAARRAASTSSSPTCRT